MAMGELRQNNTYTYICAIHIHDTYNTYTYTFIARYTFRDFIKDL